MAKFVINKATAADHELIAAVAGKVIRVTNINFICSGTVTVTFKDGTTAVSGPMAFTAQTGMSPGHSPSGHFKTTAGAAFNMTLGAAVQVSGWGEYELE